MSELKRSTEDLMYASPSDYQLIVNGIKTATSRYGIRKEFKVGKIMKVMKNDESEDFLIIEITEIHHSTLETVGGFYTNKIGNYGPLPSTGHSRMWESVVNRFLSMI